MMSSIDSRFCSPIQTKRCTGFLAGFAAGGQVEECSEEVTEILSDIEQIARAEIEGAEDNEEEELAMTEIVEYLRVVCLTLREEFRPAEPADVLH